MRRLGLLVLLVGCGREAPPPPAPAPAPVTTRVASPPRLPTTSLWRGQYLCAQGPTGMFLTLQLGAEGEVHAIFDFQALPDHPGPATGSYAMVGTVTALDDGRLRVDLVPDRWLVAPPHYEMVGLTAISDRARQQLTGRIEHPACGELSLERAALP